MKGFRKSVAVLGVVMASTAATSLFAADRETVLTKASDGVLINQGERYVEASEGMQLFTGDKLMIMQSGSAQMQLVAGCLVELKPNTVLTISEGMSCEPAASAGTNFQAAPVPPPTGTGTGGTAGSGGNLIGGLFGAAVGIGIAESALDDNDRPSGSP